MIYRHVAHRRCRFVTAGGKLSKARSCSRPIELRARGSAHWTLRVRTIPMGQYLVRSDAVDRLHHHQRPAGRTVWIGKVK
jgi:hypothetical protein